jgi:hypothetical protein
MHKKSSVKAKDSGLGKEKRVNIIPQDWVHCQSLPDDPRNTKPRPFDVPKEFCEEKSDSI